MIENDKLAVEMRLQADAPLWKVLYDGDICLLKVSSQANLKLQKRKLGLRIPAFVFAILNRCLCCFHIQRSKPVNKIDC